MKFILEIVEQNRFKIIFLNIRDKYMIPVILDNMFKVINRK